MTLSRACRLRIATSRAISRRLLGADIMLCAIAHQRGWWIRHPLNWLFWRERDHCASAAEWEAAQRERPVALADLGAVDRLRGCGM